MAYTMKVTRGELCALLIACAVCSRGKDGRPNEKYSSLHNKLRTILDDFDKKVKEG